eukprot:PhM_4_TR18875/c3_g2_i1/m.48169
MDRRKSTLITNINDRLIRLHNVLRHNRVKHDEADFIESHDFAVALIHQICGKHGLDLTPLKTAFLDRASEAGTMTEPELCDLLTWYFFHREEEEGQLSPASSPPRSPSSRATTSPQHDVSSFDMSDVSGESSYFHQSFTVVDTFVEAVSELHRAVDIEGTGEITYEQLENYFVSACLVKNAAMSETNIPELQLLHVETNNPMFDATSIMQIINLQRRHVLICSTAIYLTTTVFDNTPLAKPLRFERRNVLDNPREWGAVTCYTYLDEGWLIAGFVDLHIRVFDMGMGRAKPIKTHALRLPASITALHWHKRLRYVYSGDRFGNVVAYTIAVKDAGEDKAFALTAVHRAILHVGSVTAFHSLPQDAGLVSVSMDNSMCMFDTHLKPVCRFEGHTAGIVCVAYCAVFNFLITAGFDCEAMTWLVTTAVHTPFKLKDAQRPHSSCIIAIESPNHTTAVYTLDFKGLLKVWDMRSHQCVQNVDVGRLTDMKYRESLRFVAMLSFRLSATQTYIVCATNRKAFYVFDTSRTDRASNVTDTHPLVAVTYLPTSMTLMTTSTHCVRVWDRANDSFVLRSTFPHVEYLQNDQDAIVAFATLDDDRKYFVAYRHGTVAVHGAVNGSLVRTFSANVHRMIMSGTRARSVYCVGSAGFVVIREPLGTVVPVIEAPVSSIAYNRNAAIIVVSTEAGDISIHNAAMEAVSQFPVMGRISRQSQGSAEVSDIEFLGNTGTFAVGYTLGSIRIYSVRTAECRLTFSIDAVGKQPYTPAIVKLVHCADNQQLWCADDAGQITIFDVTGSPGEVCGIKSFTCHTETVADLCCVSPDIFVSVGLDQFVVVHTKEATRHTALTIRKNHTVSVDVHHDVDLEEEDVFVHPSQLKLVDDLDAINTLNSKLAPHRRASFAKPKQVVDVSRERKPSHRVPAMGHGGQNGEDHTDNLLDRRSTSASLWSFVSPNLVASSSPSNVVAKTNSDEPSRDLQLGGHGRSPSAAEVKPWDLPSPAPTPLPSVEYPSSNKPDSLVPCREGTVVNAVSFMDGEEFKGWAGDHPNLTIRQAYRVAVETVKKPLPEQKKRGTGIELGDSVVVQPGGKVLDISNLHKTNRAWLPVPSGHGMFLENIKERRKHGLSSLSVALIPPNDTTIPNPMSQKRPTSACRGIASVCPSTTWVSQQSQKVSPPPTLPPAVVAQQPVLNRSPLTSLTRPPSGRSGTSTPGPPSMMTYFTGTQHRAPSASSTSSKMMIARRRGCTPSPGKTASASRLIENRELPTFPTRPRVHVDLHKYKLSQNKALK